MTDLLSWAGHGWQVDYTSGASEIRGGPLEGEYALAQYHCHWGREDSRGSEHTVDGQRCAAEVSTRPVLSVVNGINALQ